MTCNRALLAALPLVALLAACDRSDPPSDRFERAAEELVAEVEGEALPVQPDGPYAPRDECLDQPGASEFLANLRTAVRDRDADRLLGLAAEDVLLDFGGGSGRDELRERLAANDGELWEQLDVILTLGCASDGARLTMPWYFAQEIGDLDPYGAMVVTGEDVPLYAAETGEEELRQLDWEMVTRVSFLEIVENEGSRWQVELQDGTRGFVPQDKLRSLIDYRIGAARRNGRWRITNFVAGD